MSEKNGKKIDGRKEIRDTKARGGWEGGEEIGCNSPVQNDKNIPTKEFLLCVISLHTHVTKKIVNAEKLNRSRRP